MAKKPAQNPAGKNSKAPLEIDANEAKEATGTEDLVLSRGLIEQTVSALWLPERLSEADRLAHAKSAFKMLQGIKPADELEGMLATQMVATHHAAMECLRRAMLENQTFEGRNQALKHAAKLMSIYARQMEALNKHRGKGQQKVTVEHVHVEAGAHAVVGNVHTTPAAPQQPAQQALAHTPGETLDLRPRKPSKTNLKRSGS